MEKLINFVKIVDLNLYDKVFINMTSVLNNMFYPTMINELANETNDKISLKVIFFYYFDYYVLPRMWKYRRTINQWRV